MKHCVHENVGHPNARPIGRKAITPGSIIELPTDDEWFDDEDNRRRTIRRVLYDDGVIAIVQTTSDSYILSNACEPWEEYTRLQDLANSLVNASADELDSHEVEVLQQMGWLVLSADVSAYERDVTRREANAAIAPAKAKSGVKKAPK